MRLPQSRNRKAHYLLFAGALLLSTACSETADMVDDGGECWPIDTAVAGAGSIQIGSGYGEFAAFEDGQEVDVEAGGQGGFHIRIATRIEGLEPGDADNILSARNPRTRFNYIDKNGDPITTAGCPMRIPYGDKGDGLELLRPFSLVFPIEPDIQDRYDNEPVTIHAEIIDAEGNFAFTEHTMIARFPEQPPTIGANISDTPEVMAPSL